MPYDRNGKYYRQPVYNENFILNKTKKSDSEVKSENKSRKSYEYPVMIITTCIFLILPILLPKTSTPSKPKIRKNNYDKAPSVEKTLDNMLQYQKEKDARRRSYEIIDNFIFNK